ncbi:uncharacterized protein LOC135365601 [Mirounga angustirostris]|uniref:uncharacterized protein LOC135365601 n=1 Tax=Mirounga angustirostris TaxID=9716 RepID=UPI00313D6F0A
MTRLVGTATWVGAAEGGGGAPMSWMGSEGLAGGGPQVFGAVLAARRDKRELRCSRSPSRPPFHILRRRRGAAAETAFYKRHRSGLQEKEPTGSVIRQKAETVPVECFSWNGAYKF